METSWQLTWVIDRLAPRWIVEEVAGQRNKRVRLAFVDARPAHVERVVMGIVAHLGKSWRVEMRTLPPRDLPAAMCPPLDLVWAIGSPSRLAVTDRRGVIEKLVGALAPGGCFIVEPSDTTVLDAGLSPCSSPGVFFKCE